MKPQQTVAVFVDVQNIYYTTRQCFSRHFDYNSFWAEVTRDRTVVKAIAFAIDRGDEKQGQFQNILRAIGFDVKLRPFIQRRDGSAKGDWDVGITLDVLEYAPLADVVVLASGDGDFDLLVNKIRDKHQVSVEVYGVAELSAASLIRAADRFVPIKDHLLLEKATARGE
ncbi:MAG: NYN domain-containing protein [Gammaproteobacteria bacterium]